MWRRDLESRFPISTFCCRTNNASKSDQQNARFPSLIEPLFSLNSRNSQSTPNTRGHPFNTLRIRCYHYRSHSLPSIQSSFVYHFISPYSPRAELIMRFSTIATAFLAPLYVQAFVAFTNNAYTGITAGAPFTLTWSGDNSVILPYL